MITRFCILLLVLGLVMAGVLVQQDACGQALGKHALRFDAGGTVHLAEHSLLLNAAMVYDWS